MIAKKAIGLTISLALIGAGVVAMVLVNKKTCKKAADLVETAFSEAQNMIM